MILVLDDNSVTLFSRVIREGQLQVFLVARQCLIIDLIIGRYFSVDISWVQARS